MGLVDLVFRKIFFRNYFDDLKSSSTGFLDFNTEKKRICMNSSDLFPPKLDYVFVFLIWRRIVPLLFSSLEWTKDRWRILTYNPPILLFSHSERTMIYILCFLNNFFDCFIRLWSRCTTCNFKWRMYCDIHHFLQWSKRIEEYAFLLP